MPKQQSLNRNFRRGNSGKLPNYPQIKRATELLRQRKKLKLAGQKPQTLRSIASQCGFFSPTTIWRYSRKNMTLHAIRLRQLQKIGNKRIISEEQEEIFAGWVIYRELTHECTTSDAFQEFVSSSFGIRVSASYLTRFMKRNYLSLKLPSNASPKELNEEEISEAVDYLRNLNEFIKLNDVSASKIVAIDKTSLFNSMPHKYIRHISSRGKNKPRKETPTRGAAHVGYTALRADGTKFPFYVETSDRNLILCNFENILGNDGFVAFVAKNQRRRAEFGFLCFLEYMCLNKHLRRGDILIFDGEKTFVTELITEFFSKHGIFYFPIKPAVLHALLNPCDNAFHSRFKLSYNRKISRCNAITYEEKFRMARDCYNEISRDSVRSWFNTCGIWSDSKDFEAIVLNLVNEGIRSQKGGKRKFHQHNLQVFIQWCRENNLVDVHLKLLERCKMQIQGFLKKQ